ncbi:hypothetical protein F0310_05075 (plasmid) [Borrelia sp. A-FGy1]|uniref:plasmid maintenance protein n=1 Tax=Borrelia sp. A-FGy1 TaxID=2608247 RepID=UPI0015F36D5B|nr:plasmid maintenance protein [Borrelia sp. A-FGy1]QMU99790.1 hypothetical protein F0310_05075 [Borrelia sp. A-FGy1]
MIENVNQKKYHCLTTECSSTKQTNLVILVSTLDFVNNKHKQYTQKYLYYCFTLNQKRFRKKIVSQETFRKYLYTLEKLKITDNYCHRKGKQKGSEIRYTLLHDKKECNRLINNHFMEEKEKSFSIKFKAYWEKKQNKSENQNKKILTKNTYDKYQCNNNNKNNNIKNIEKRENHSLIKTSKESFKKDKKNKKNKTRHEKYANKCEFKSTNILSLISKLDTNESNKINHLKNYKRIELECKNTLTNELEAIVFPIIKNNYKNPYYLYKFNEYGFFNRIVEYFNGDKSKFEVKDGVIYKKNMYITKDFNRKRKDSLQKMIENVKQELIKKHYKQEDLDIEFTKLFDKYKTKPHFILEHNKYKDLSRFINYVKNKYYKVETSEETEANNRSALFSIILDRATLKYPSIEVQEIGFKVRNYMRTIENIEWALIKDNTYLYDFMDRLKNEEYMSSNNEINTLKVSNSIP